MSNKRFRLTVSVVIIVLMSIIAMGCKKEAIVKEEKKIIINDDSDKKKEVHEEVDNTTLNLATEDAVAYSEIPANEKEEEEEPVIVEEKDEVKRTEDGKIIIDLVMFMGQSNMSGTGGNAEYAPAVKEGHGFEFRAISDPTRLYPITEPFGINENNPNAIKDTQVGKKGSLVSAFANEYYELTGIPIVGVSASSGGTDTAFWMNPVTIADFSERQKRAQVWLESNDYYIRKQYVIWLQGESDAMDGITSEQYNQNMDNIIRPLFIGGVQKVFMITPGRTLSIRDFFDDVTNAQINMCRTSGYYALATTILDMVSTEYMVDEFHYNQSVLNLIGREAAVSAAYYTNNRKEMCIYDYEHDSVFVPEGFEYTEDEMKAEAIDYNTNGDLVRY